MSERRKSVCVCMGMRGTNIDPGVKRSITTRAIKHRRVCDGTWPTLHLVKIALDRRGGKRRRARDVRRLRICTTSKNVSKVPDNRDATLGLHLKAPIPAKRRKLSHPSPVATKWDEDNGNVVCPLNYAASYSQSKEWGKLNCSLKVTAMIRPGIPYWQTYSRNANVSCLPPWVASPVLRFLSCICRMLLIGNPDSPQWKIQNINIPWHHFKICTLCTSNIKSL